MEAQRVIKTEKEACRDWWCPLTVNGKCIASECPLWAWIVKENVEQIKLNEICYPTKEGYLEAIDALLAEGWQHDGVVFGGDYFKRTLPPEEWKGRCDAYT